MWHIAEIAPTGLLGLSVFSYPKGNFLKFTNLFTHLPSIEQIYGRRNTRYPTKKFKINTVIYSHSC